MDEKELPYFGVRFAGMPNPFPKGWRPAKVGALFCNRSYPVTGWIDLKELTFTVDVEEGTVDLHLELTADDIRRLYRGLRSLEKERADMELEIPRDEP